MEYTENLVLNQYERQLAEPLERIPISETTRAPICEMNDGLEGPTRRVLGLAIPQGTRRTQVWDRYKINIPNLSAALWRQRVQTRCLPNVGGHLHRRDSSLPAKQDESIHLVEIVRPGGLVVNSVEHRPVRGNVSIEDCHEVQRFLTLIHVRRGFSVCRNRRETKAKPDDNSKLAWAHATQCKIITVIEPFRAGVAFCLERKKLLIGA